MVFRQFVDDDLGCGSYLLGDAESGDAVVVDPAFAIGQYVEAAEAEGLRIVRVLETHTHADHLSGHGRFALEHGLPVSIHPLAQPEYPFDPLADGDIVHVGALEVHVLHTPGHRPEHCAFVADGVVLTGDSLFVGAAARPDLAIEARAGAADLWRSVHRLAELPEETVVYPGHVSGSLCGTNMSREHSTSIGRERASNAVLRTAEPAFVDESASIATPRPPTTERLVALNRGPWVAARPPLAQLDDAGSGLVLDVRPVLAFAGGHRPGAISVALDGGSFATRSAFVLDAKEPVVLQAGSADHAVRAAQLLWAVGLFETRGYVLEGDGEQLPTLTVAELSKLLAHDDVQLLDVREPTEHEHEAPGAIRIPYRELRHGPPAGLDPGRPVYTICASGARAVLSASLLGRRGFDARAVVGGGVDDLM
jgi:hydroxyacylglutathione hydrolase